MPMNKSHDSHPILFNIEGKCSAIQSGKPKAIISLFASDSHAVR